MKVIGILAALCWVYSAYVVLFQTKDMNRTSTHVILALGCLVSALMTLMVYDVVESFL